MRILLINPNTTSAVTALMADLARERVGPEVEIVAVTGRFGARYIASRAGSAIAGHAALDALAEHGAGCDAVYLACFGDPGLFALKELATVPVVGMAEAACAAALALAPRFSIVTGGVLWQTMLREFVTALGHAENLASIRTIAPTGGEIARDPDAALAGLAAACEECARQDGADVVILGGAALARLAARIQPQVSIPVICSVEAGLDAVLAAGRNGQAEPPVRGAPIESVGLSQRLEAALRRDLRTA